MLHCKKLPLCVSNTKIPTSELFLSMSLHRERCRQRPQCKHTTLTHTLSQCPVAKLPNRHEAASGCSQGRHMQHNNIRRQLRRAVCKTMLKRAVDAGIAAAAATVKQQQHRPDEVSGKATVRKSNKTTKSTPTAPPRGSARNAN